MCLAVCSSVSVRIGWTEAEALCAYLCVFLRLCVCPSVCTSRQRPTERVINASGHLGFANEQTTASPARVPPPPRHKRTQPYAQAYTHASTPADLCSLHPAEREAIAEAQIAFLCWSNVRPTGAVFPPQLGLLQKPRGDIFIISHGHWNYGWRTRRYCMQGLQRIDIL